MLVARYRLLRLRIEACPGEAGSTVRASCCLLDRLYASNLSVQQKHDGHARHGHHPSLALESRLERLTSSGTGPRITYRRTAW